jgi:hypothetical protein
MGRNEYGFGAQSNIALVMRAKTPDSRGFDAWSKSVTNGTFCTKILYKYLVKYLYVGSADSDY